VRHATVQLVGPLLSRRVCLWRWPTCPLCASATDAARLLAMVTSASMSTLRNTSASSVRLVVRANAWASCLPRRPELAAALKRERRPDEQSSSGAHDSCGVIQTLLEQIQSNASPAPFLPSLSGSPCILPSPPPSLLAAVELRCTTRRRSFCHVAAHVDVPRMHA
jgi:hypothetical protein